MRDPVATCIVPTRGREPFLPELLSSIWKQGVPLEVLHVDAPPYANAWIASITDTPAFQTRVDLRYVRQLEGRKGSALNLGVSLARSDVLLFVDADVTLPPGIVREALDLLRTYDIVSSKRRHEQLGWNVLTEPLLPRISFAGPWFTMVRRGLTRDLQWVDHPVEDVDWWLRTRRADLSVGYTTRRVRLKRRVRHEWRKGFALWRELIRR